MCVFLLRGEGLENIRENLSACIRERREELGFTQATLAEMVSVSLRGIQEIEYKRAWPNPETLAKIAEALQCKVSDLLGERLPAAILRPHQMVPSDIMTALPSCGEVEFDMIRAILRGRGKMSDPKISQK